MKRKQLITLIGSILLMITLFLTFKLKSGEKEEGFDFEERPHETISPEERVVNERHRARFKAKRAENRLKSTEEASVYANGMLTGNWEYKKFSVTSGQGKGYRVVGSAYDPEHDNIYAVSYAGHLWRIDREPEINWVLLNHKEKFKNFLKGVNLEDGTFRLIHSSGKAIRYSDDEGRTWNESQGTNLKEATGQGAVVKHTSGKKVIVVGKGADNLIKVFVSSDYGITFSGLQKKFDPAKYDIQVCHPYYSEDFFVFARDVNTSTITIYKYAKDAEQLTELKTTTHTFSGGLKKVLGTYSGEKFHFYVIAPKTNIYYSDDEGSNWKLTYEKNDQVPKTMHPDKPNILFKGFVDIKMSEDYGATWKGFKHKLGWDLQHAEMYKKKNGTYFHFVGKDFGCFVSDYPDSIEAYSQLNHNSSIQMCYDAAFSDKYNTVFTALQDRGCRGFFDESNPGTKELGSTDVLRVALANNEKSVWYWYYYGSMGHHYNFGTGNSGGKKKLSWTGRWWAGVLVASPDSTEDAVVVASGPNLRFFHYDADAGKISKTDHPYDFKEVSGSGLTGFNYSPADRNLWFASVKSGKFYYSKDGGKTFVETESYGGAMPKANDQKYNYTRNQHVIRASKYNPNKVWYAGVGKVFLISNDGGKTFKNHNKGLDVYRIRDFAVSEDEKFIFAACAGSGAWVYSVEDDYWYELNDEAVPNVDFTAVHCSPEKGEVKFSTFGYGVLSFKRTDKNKVLRTTNNLTASLNEDESVYLSWIDISDSESGYYVQRMENGEFVTISTLDANTVSFLDENIMKGKDYYYRIVGFNKEKEFLPSSFVSLRQQGSSGISEKKKSNVKLYPNPFVDYVDVESGELKIEKISVYSQNGRLVLEKSIRTDNSPIRLYFPENLEPGAYLVKIWNKDNTTQAFSLIKR